MFCSNCGNKVEDGMTFCAKCGTPVKKEEEQRVFVGQNSTEAKNVTSQEKIIESEIPSSDTDLQSAYISGRTSDFYSDKGLRYYLKTFKKFDLNGNPTFKWDWNWSSFILCGFHLLYRKNFITGIISLIVFSILAQWSVFIILPDIILGGCANYLMYRQYLSKLKQVQAAYPKDKQKQMEELAEIGGRAEWVKILVVVYIILYAIYYFYVA